MFEAARRDRPDVLALLLDLGTPLEIAGPDRQTHAARGGREQCPPRRAFLVERGAEIDPRESTYDGDANWLGGARRPHRDGELSQPVTAAISGRFVSTATSIACARFCRRIPAARAVATDDGITPLWWLPDDEAKAMQIVELLLAAGADPSAKSKNGGTAADLGATPRHARRGGTPREAPAGSPVPQFPSSPAPQFSSDYLFLPM